MAKKDPQGVYVPTRGNDVLEELINNFQKAWKERKITLTSAEKVAAAQAITDILS